VPPIQDIQSSRNTGVTDAVLQARGLTCPLLGAAVRRIEGRLSEGERSSEEVLDLLLSLAAEAEAARDGEPTTPPVATRLRDRMVQLRLLGMLEEEILRGWAEHHPRAPDPTAVLSTLKALQRFRGGDARESAQEDLAARLTEPDAFELIVEVAHDLRSPLTSVLFLAETLRGGHSGPVSELQRTQLGLIYSAAVGMVSIASDVMELARGGTHLSEDHPVPLSIGEIFETVGEVLRPMAEAKGIDLRFGRPEEDRRLGYPVPISRVLLNLTTNALKFTDTGFVEVSAEAVGYTEVLFSVRDTGRGIDPRNQVSLYEPFKKAEQREGHFFSGSGLGLSIARRLVRAMGSTLDFETGSDWGTRFHFRLDLPHAAPGG